MKGKWIKVIAPEAPFSIASEEMKEEGPIDKDILSAKMEISKKEEKKKSKWGSGKRNVKAKKKLI